MNDYKLNLLPHETYEACYPVYTVDITDWGEGGGSGHFIPGYHKVLNKGMMSLINEAESSIENLQVWVPGSLEKKIFWEATIISLRAAIEFARRYAELAREMANTVVDDSRKKELYQIAEHCQHVPAFPARTFWEFPSCQLS